MLTLEALRRTVGTVEDVQSMVRTMKVLAAVSIHQYERAAASVAEYDRSIRLGIRAALDDEWSAGSKPRPARERRVGAVVFGSDHGLCGRFNEDIARFAIDQLKAMDTTAGRLRLLCVGARLSNELALHRQHVDTHLYCPAAASGIGAIVHAILTTFGEWESTHGANELLLFHNVRRPGGAAAPCMRRLVPIDLEQFRGAQNERWPGRGLPTHRAPKAQLLSSLIREYLYMRVFRACTESLVSEHASRLAAMQIAESNIQDRLDELGTQYRQRYQDTVTEELLDVVTGAEAINAASW